MFSRQDFLEISVAAEGPLSGQLTCPIPYLQSPRRDHVAHLGCWSWHGSGGTVGSFAVFRGAVSLHVKGC